MMFTTKLLSVTILFLNVFVAIQCTIFHAYPVISSNVKGNNYGEPLFLTPYLERGDIEGAQEAALVRPFYGNIISFSGFLTVNKVYNSNLFFWFFPAETGHTTAPVVVWLQGGPGVSSLYGLFTQHGPFYVDENKQILPREYYWTKKLNVLYIDNPVGAGFSFTTNPKGYAKNQKEIAENLYKAIQQFFQLFPQYLKNDFYVAGESFAGKFTPVFAHKIHESNKNLIKPNKRINLRGIAIGNGACDPIYMLKYDEFLYQLGLIDMNTKLKMENIENEIVLLLKQDKYEESLKLLNNLFYLFHTSTGFTYLFNFLNNKGNEADNLAHLLDDSDFRKALRVGNLNFSNGDIVKMYLKEEIVKSVKPWIEDLLEHYKVLIYTGQLDIVIAYPLVVNYIQSMKWYGAEEYKTAERKLWYVDNELAGYKKTVGKLTEVLVRNAGHMVPTDQPKWAFDLISNFTNT